VILMGGRGAGRSYEASQLIIANLVQSKRLFRGAIMRAVHSDSPAARGPLHSRN
jgi:hypothetical protein